jgi:hypothetical protein
MTRVISMRDTVKAVRDAHRVVAEALPRSTAEESRRTAFAAVLRELLDNEYADDLPAKSPDAVKGKYSVLVYQGGVGELAVAGTEVEESDDPGMIQLTVYVVRPGT